MKRVIPPSPPWRYGDSDASMAPMKREVYNPVIDVRIADVRIDHDIERMGHGSGRSAKIVLEAPLTEELHDFLNILRGGGRVQLTSPDVKRERIVPSDFERDYLSSLDPSEPPDNTPEQPKKGAMKTQNAEVGTW